MSQDLAQTDSLLGSILSLSSKSANGQYTFSLDAVATKCNCDVQSITDKLQGLKGDGVRYHPDHKSWGMLIRILKQPEDIDELMKKVPPL